MWGNVSSPLYFKKHIQADKLCLEIKVFVEGDQSVAAVDEEPQDESEAIEGNFIL